MYDYTQLVALTEETNARLDTINESINNLNLVNSSILLGLLIVILLSFFRS